MKYLLSLIIFFSFSHTTNKAELIEISFGKNRPTGEFGDRYADDGFSFRVSYSKSFENNGLFKYQYSGQYIHFGTNYYTDQFLMESGLYGPNVNVRNREQAFLFSAGLRLTATRGISQKGLFRPYVGSSIGLAFFSEKTVWDWGNNWEFDDCSGTEILLSILFQDIDWCDNNSSMQNTIHSKVEPVFTLDLGTNLFFKENQKIGVDFGVRYNMVTGLKKPSVVYDYENDTHSYIIDKLKVDYYTIYFGLSFKLDPLRKEKRANKRGKGRHI